MSTLSDLQKKLQEESEGIMFPFRTAVKKQTTQPVLDTTTDSIMSKTKEVAVQPVDPSEVYKGPAVIRYSAEGEKSLVEPDAGMLAGSPFKFSIDPITGQEKPLPQPGEGIVEDVTPTPTPPITTPVEPEQPAFDPCPDGFKFDPQLQRCVPIEKQKSDRQTGVSNPPRNIGSTAKALDNIAQTAIKDGLHTKYGEEINITIDNSTILSKLGPLGKLIDGILIKGPADKRLDNFGDFTDLSTDGITVTTNSDGTRNVNMTHEGKYNFGKIQTDESLRGNLASTQKTDISRGGPGNIIMGPNNTPMIIGPISVNTFGAVSKEFRPLTAEESKKMREDMDAQFKEQQERKKLDVAKTSAPKARGTGKEAGFLGFERGVRGSFAQAPSQTGKVKKSATQISNELDDLLAKGTGDERGPIITEADRQAAKGTTGSSANKKDKGKIVCTMMNESYGFGSFRNKIWLAQSRNLAKEYEIGYHTLFLPLVKYAKQKGFMNNIVKKVLEHIAIHRTIDIRKQKYNKVDVLGRTYRTILEPLCYITGGIKTWKKK